MERVSSTNTGSDLASALSSFVEAAEALHMPKYPMGKPVLVDMDCAAQVAAAAIRTYNRPSRITPGVGVDLDLNLRMWYTSVVGWCLLYYEQHVESSVNLESSRRDAQHVTRSKGEMTMKQSAAQNVRKLMQEFGVHTLVHQCRSHVCRAVKNYSGSSDVIRHKNKALDDALYSMFDTATREPLLSVVLCRMLVLRELLRWDFFSTEFKFSMNSKHTDKMEKTFDDKQRKSSFVMENYIQKKAAEIRQQVSSSGELRSVILGGLEHGGWPSFTKNLLIDMEKEIGEHACHIALQKEAGKNSSGGSTTAGEVLFSAWQRTGVGESAQWETTCDRAHC